MISLYLPSQGNKELEERAEQDVEGKPCGKTNKGRGIKHEKGEDNGRLSKEGGKTQ